MIPASLLLITDSFAVNSELYDSIWTLGAVRRPFLFSDNYGWTAAEHRRKCHIRKEDVIFFLNGYGGFPGDDITFIVHL